MAEALHRAIQDALRDGQGYTERGILVTVVLEATRPLQAEDSLLYRAIYTIFRALPDRLLRGTTLNIATIDTAEGVDLLWEGREELRGEVETDSGVRRALSSGPNGDLIELAYVALENFCQMRAGHVEVRRERMSASSSFARPAHLLRRVTAHIPASGPGTPLPVARSLPADSAHATLAQPGTSGPTHEASRRGTSLALA